MTHSSVVSRWNAVRPCIFMGIAMGLLFWGAIGRLGQAGASFVWLAATAFAGYLCAYRLRAHERDPWTRALGQQTMSVLYALTAMGFSFLSMAACFLLWAPK